MDYLGKPKGIKSSLWVRKSDIENYDDGLKKGKSGLRKYYQNMLKNNPESSTYPKKLRQYHKTVIKSLY